MAPVGAAAVVNLLPTSFMNKTLMIYHASPHNPGVGARAADLRVVVENPLMTPRGSSQIICVNQIVA